MTAIERKKSMIEMLCEKRMMRIQVLADIFGVSIRTIKRDVQELSLSHLLSAFGGGITLYWSMFSKAFPRGCI